MNVVIWQVNGKPENWKIKPSGFTLLALKSA
jgi:hypothetical protein